MTPTRALTVTLALTLTPLHHVPDTLHSTAACNAAHARVAVLQVGCVLTLVGGAWYGLLQQGFLLTCFCLFSFHSFVQNPILPSHCHAARSQGGHTNVAILGFRTVFDVLAALRGHEAPLREQSADTKVLFVMPSNS